MNPFITMTTTATTDPSFGGADQSTTSPDPFVVENSSSSSFDNETLADSAEFDDGGWTAFNAIVRVTVPVIFGAIAVLGLVGNLLVIVVVVRNRTMRSTTNALIVSLALADLVFIVICVPLTALSYTQTPWLFGRTVCRVYQNVIHVTAYASVYTLVLMSLDRYLAVVHPIRSMTLRTERNAWILIGVVWGLIAVGQVPTFNDFDLYVYPNGDGADGSICINMRLLLPDGVGYDTTYAQVFYGTFFVFGYVLPLTLVSVLYGLMIRRLLFGESTRPSSTGARSTRDLRQRRSTTISSTSTAVATRPRSASRAISGSGLSETIKARRRVTRMVVIVIVIFAVCWLPLHVAFVVQFFAPSLEIDGTVWFVAVKIACTCLAYMNSCVNPILYAFLSENFRKSFRRLVLPVAAVCFRVSASSSGVVGPSGRMSLAVPTAANPGEPRMYGGESYFLRGDRVNADGQGDYDGEAALANACVGETNLLIDRKCTPVDGSVVEDGVWKSTASGCNATGVTCL